MIFVAFGANLPGPLGPPANTIAALIETVAEGPLLLRATSRLYRSAPLPVSGQPWFLNGMMGVETDWDPEALLAYLHRLEARFGRTRQQRWEARVLDLDLIDYHKFVTIGAAREAEPVPGAPWSGATPLVLPHPRLHLRAFVLKPLIDIAPDWRHPVSGRLARELLDDLGDAQICEPVTN